MGNNSYQFVISITLSVLALVATFYNAWSNNKRNVHQNNLDNSNTLLNQQKLISELQKENQEMRTRQSELDEENKEMRTRQLELDEKYKDIKQGIIDVSMQIQLFGEAKITSQKWRGRELQASGDDLK